MRSVEHISNLDRHATTISQRNISTISIESNHFVYCNFERTTKGNIILLTCWRCYTELFHLLGYIKRSAACCRTSLFESVTLLIFEEEDYRDIDSAKALILLESNKLALVGIIISLKTHREKVSFRVPVRKDGTPLVRSAAVAKTH